MHRSAPLSQQAATGAASGDANSFRCTLMQCQQRFATLVGLRQHIRHTHPRAYRCTVPKCFEQFHSASELAHHVRERHSRNLIRGSAVAPLPEPELAIALDLPLLSDALADASTAPQAPPPQPPPQPPQHGAVAVSLSRSLAFLCPLAPRCSFAGADSAAVRAHVDHQFGNAGAAAVVASMAQSGGDEQQLVAEAADDSQVLAEPPERITTSVAAAFDVDDVRYELMRPFPSDDLDLDAWLAGAHGALSRCDLCSFVCVELSDMVRHRRLHEIDDSAVHCQFPGCQRAFPSRAALRLHARSHMAPASHACPMVGCTHGHMATMGDLQTHCKAVHATQLSFCTLPACGRIFPNAELLRAHVAHDHAIAFRCTFPMCARTYTSYQRLQRHIKEAHLKYLLPQAFCDFAPPRAALSAMRSFGPFGEQFAAALPKRPRALAPAQLRLMPPPPPSASAGGAGVLENDDESVSGSGMSMIDLNLEDSETVESPRRPTSQQKRSASSRTATAAAAAAAAASTAATAVDNDGDASSRSGSVANSGRGAAKKRARKLPVVAAPVIEAPGEVIVVPDAAPNKRGGRGGATTSARRKVKAMPEVVHVVDNDLHASGGDVEIVVDGAATPIVRRSRGRAPGKRGATASHEVAAALDALPVPPERAPVAPTAMATLDDLVAGATEPLVAEPAPDALLPEPESVPPVSVPPSLLPPPPPPPPPPVLSRWARTRPKFSRGNADDSIDDAEEAEDGTIDGDRAALRSVTRRPLRRLTRAPRRPSVQAAVMPPTILVEADPLSTPPSAPHIIDDGSMDTASSSSDDGDDGDERGVALPAPVLMTPPRSPAPVVVDLRSPEASFDLLQARMQELMRSKSPAK
jgi:hypothetical protein